MINLESSYYFKIKYRDFIFLLFLWILLFIEPIALGPLKISQIWKSFFVIGMFFYLLGKKLPSFIWFGYLFALKYLIYTYIPYGFITAIQNSLEAIIFPLVLGFFYFKFRYRPHGTNRLIHISILLSLFFIFSTVPFIFGLKSLNPETDLSKFGIDGTATKGLFYHIAVSSKVFTISTIVLINCYNRFSNNFFNKFLWLTSVLLGSWFVFTSWTRTGWFLFLFALLISFFYNSTLKKKVFYLVISSFMVILFFWMFENNLAFRYRLTGGAVYRTDTEFSFQQLAESRIPFIIIAIDNLKNEGFLGQMLGYGENHTIDFFEQKTGMSIVSHNGTFNILEASGFIGLILYFLFIFYLYKKVKLKWMFVDGELRRIIITLTFLFLGFFISSHGTPFWGEIIYSCFLISILRL